ncbi:MAG: BamA/TamA family outer membrane protein [Calditrichota bacterium]
MKNSNRIQYYVVPLLLLFMLLSSTSLSAQSDSTATANKDSYGGKSNWERAVDLPGQLIYLPFRLILEGTSAGIEAIYENHLIPRIATALTSEDGKRGLRPIYSSRSGFGAKFFWKDFITSGGRFTPKASIGLRMRQAYELEAKNISLLSGNLAFGVTAGYYNQPDESFFGIGIDTDKDDRTNFAREIMSVEVHLGPKLTDRLTSDISLGIERNNILPGRDTRRTRTNEVFNSMTLPGLETGVNLGHVEVNLAYDGTNSLGNPSKGTLASIHAGVFSQMGDESTYGFIRSGMDVSQHLNIYEDRILVFRVAAEDVSPRDGKAVPFYYLSELGSQETIRGFPRGRFFDEDMLMGSAEYRFPLRRRTTKESISALLFVDAGKVTPDLFNSINADDLEVTYGLGLRIWKQSGLITKFEVGFSSDGFRLIFNIE